MAVTCCDGVMAMWFCSGMRILRYPLPDLEKIRPWIAPQISQPVAKIIDREVIRPQPFRQFLPCERRRNRSLRQRAGRVRGDRGRSALVAQSVDEDAAA